MRLSVACMCKSLSLSYALASFLPGWLLPWIVKGVLRALKQLALSCTLRMNKSRGVKFTIFLLLLYRINIYKRNTPSLFELLLIRVLASRNNSENVHTHLQYHRTWVARRAIALEMLAERYIPIWYDDSLLERERKMQKWLQLIKVFIF